MTQLHQVYPMNLPGTSKELSKDRIVRFTRRIYWTSTLQSRDIKPENSKQPRRSVLLYNILYIYIYYILADPSWSTIYYIYILHPRRSVLLYIILYIYYILADLSGSILYYIYYILADPSCSILYYIYIYYILADPSCSIISIYKFGLSVCLFVCLSVCIQ